MSSEAESEQLATLIRKRKSPAQRGFGELLGLGEISSLGQETLGLLPRVAGFLEPDSWIDADRQRLQAARVSIGQTPALAPSGINHN